MQPANAAQLVQNQNKVECPDEYKCAICLDIMKEPSAVTSGNGQNNEVKHYDKNCVIKLKEDPQTRMRIIAVAPDRGLHQRILAWRKEHRKEEFVQLPGNIFRSARSQKLLKSPIFLLADGTSCNKEDLSKADKKPIKNNLLEQILKEKQGKNYVVDIRLLQNEGGQFFQKPVIALHGNGDTVEEKSLQEQSIKNYIHNNIIKALIKRIETPLARKQDDAKHQPVEDAEKEDKLSEVKIEQRVQEQPADPLSQPLLAELRRSEGQPEVQAGEEKIPAPRREPGEEGEVLIPPEAEALNQNPEDQNLAAQREWRNEMRCRRFVMGFLPTVGVAGIGLGLGLGLRNNSSPDPSPLPKPKLPTYLPDIVPRSGGNVGVTFQNPNQQEIPINSIQIVSNAEHYDFYSTWLPQDVKMETTLNADQKAYTTTITPTGTPIRLAASGGEISFSAKKIIGPLRIKMDPKTVSADIGSGLQQLDIQGKTNASDPTPNIYSVASIPQSETGTFTFEVNFDLSTLPQRVNTIERGPITFDSNGDFAKPDTDLATEIAKTSSLKKQYPNFLRSQLNFDATPEVCEQVLNNGTASENLANKIAGAVEQTNSDAARVNCAMTADNVDQLANLAKNIKTKAPLGTKVKVPSPKDFSKISPKQLCIVEPFVDEFRVDAVRYNTDTGPVADYPQPVRADPRSPNPQSFSETLQAYNDIPCIKEPKIGVVFTTDCEAVGVDTLGNTNGVWRPVKARVMESYNYRCVTTRNCGPDSASPPSDLMCTPASVNPTGNYSQQGVCSSAQKLSVIFCEDQTSIAAKMKATQEILGNKFSGYSFDDIVRDTTVTDSSSLSNAAFDNQPFNSAFNSQPPHGSQQTNSTPNFTAESGQSFTGISFTDLFNSAIENLGAYLTPELQSAMLEAAKQGALCGFVATLTEKTLTDFLSSRINPVTGEKYSKEEIFWLAQLAKAISIFAVTLNPYAALITPVGAAYYRLHFDFETASKCTTCAATLFALLTLNPLVLAAGIGGCALGSTVVNLGCKLVSLGNSAVNYVTNSNPRQYCAKQASQVASSVQQGFFALKDRAAGIANRLNPFAQKVSVTEAVDAPVCAV